MPRRTTHITQTYDTGTNACGRLLRVDDGTGYQIFSYDHLGNMAENTRAIALPFEDSVYNFRMLFEYDSWNRVQRIVYPDSEVVTYNYDLGGQLYSVSTFKNNVSSSLINSILYDEFGHRTQVNFGNGVTTNYNYDILQRLNTLQTYSNNASLQKISYDFDLEDNITRVENTASGANSLGGAYVNTYNYDDLYRLTSANGTYAGNNTNYSLEMAYTPAGRLCSKLQDFTGTGNVYAYSPNSKQHAVRRIYNGLTNELSNLRWDNNGNLAQQTLYSVNNNVPTYLNMRMLFWDEDDRLNLVAGDGYLSYYAYGYDGNRAIKMTGNAMIDQNGVLQNTSDLNNITIYPNEYLTVTQAEYTKYYYAGGNRIASKIGTGGFGKMTRLCTQDLNLTANANSLFGNALQLVTSATNQPADEYPADVCGGYSVSTELLINPLPTFYIAQTSLNFTQNNLLQQFRQNLAGGTEPIYYFHSDHLGSASWITNGSGLPIQHLQYLPFGEHFVNEQIASYSERFTFTGKERDLKTGYYYHGARFNSSDIGWLSVDPQFEILPSTTPYNYCLWNPVVLHDPDGEFPVWIVWAIVGAGLDYGFQVYDNYQDGKSGYDAWWGDVNLASVGLSAVNPTGKFKIVGTLVVEGLKAAIEYKPNKGVSVNTNVDEVAERTIVNSTVNLSAGKVAKSGSKEAVQKANKNVATTQKKLNTAERQAQKHPQSKKKAENVKSAKADVQTARKKQVGTKMLNATVGRVPKEAVERGSTAVTDRALKKDE